MTRRKLTIVGGGTAGWFSAAYMTRHPIFDISLISTDDIPHIGVGESTVPFVIRFLDELGVNHDDWMKQTGATLKYANRFLKWQNDYHDECISFERAFPLHILMRTIDTPQSKEEYISQHDKPLTTDVILEMYKRGECDKFDKTHDANYHFIQKNVLSDGLNLPYTIAHHIDADKTGLYVRDKIAIPRGVKHIKKKVNKVNVKDDVIKSLTLDDGTLHESDYFIDATGFHRTLINHLTTATKDYHYAIDSYLVVRKNHDRAKLNHTTSTAMKHGWEFHIGLQDRVGAGYVFSSSHTTASAALEEWKQDEDARVITWTPQRMIEPAKGNCFCVGLSAGFIEPLEANSLFITVASIKHAESGIMGRGTSYYNDKMSYLIDDIYDHLSMIYAYSRKDTDFWNETYEPRDYASLAKEKYYNNVNNTLGVHNYDLLWPEIQWLQKSMMFGKDLSSWESRITEKEYQVGKEYFYHKQKKHALLAKMEKHNNSVTSL